MMSEILIVKKNGEKEPFNEDKLIRSLKKSEASDSEIEQVLEYVNANIYQGMTTGEIYARAYKALSSRKKKNPNAIRYSLKQSVMKLGPTGFPFESFVARIFVERGYTAQTGVMVQGKCIEHEVDVLAYNQEEVICIETKFHNEAYLKSDTKVALYVKARFDDLIGQPITLEGKKRTITKGMLITNTNFTHTAQKYVECSGTYEIMSWNHPKEENLLYYVEKFNLEPITVIPELSPKDVKNLTDAGVLLCSDIRENPQTLDAASIKRTRKAGVMDTIALVCKP